MEQLAIFAFGKNFLISNWLLAIGVTVFCAYTAISFLTFFAFGGTLPELLPLLPELMLDLLRYKPDIVLLVFMGLLGRKLVRHIQKGKNGRASDTVTVTFDNPVCQQVARFFEGSYRLPIWLLVPSLAWPIHLSRAVSNAYTRDLPVGLQAYFGPQPHIDDFWQDVFWPSVELSVSSISFWFFLLSLVIGVMIAACRVSRQKS